jgi:tetratricopeptide (TPR) repeat protein
LKHKPAASLDAYDLLLRAQQHEYEFTAESLTAAIGCVEQGLAIDPTYAPAMALAAYCYAERRNQGWAQNVEAESLEGLRLAARAVELGQDDGNVLWMAAFAVRQLAMDPKRAKELADLAIGLIPNSAIASAVAGWLEATTGNPRRGLELLSRGMRLSPRDPRSWFMSAGMAFAYSSDDRHEEAVTWAKRALAQNPRFAIALRLLASNLARLGRKSEATEVMQKVFKVEPQVTLTNLRARLMYLQESVWNRYADGLRLAGLPE